MSKRAEARAYAATHPDASYAEIAQAIRTDQTNVRRALNPEIDVRDNARRGPAKRAWENRMRATCARCGSAMAAGTLRADGSTRALAGDLCATCRSDDRVARVLEMARLRCVENLTDAQIGERVGSATHTVRQELCRMRALGFEVPYSPYYRTGPGRPPATLTPDAEVLGRVLAARGIVVVPAREAVAA